MITDVISHYNHLRYHESNANLTPAVVYVGHGKIALLERVRIKHQTIKTRLLYHRGQAA
jgi:putative transposase